ncbi:FeoB-associated Cys-rich membrane protein [Caenibacillus caldisaponilyticus]|uniref:FeoB-associated Cys-rich membrane protein n=1 Tax=Caenibacillus caldisaponilyticus TaxID=1674942 RepID=UPI000988342A|nr:FeoB-associated Cys-rich membrane protein [Caenibacillus caldisaponilyticus]
MIASFIIGSLIFTYAAWMLVSFFKKSRQGRCAACTLKDSCTSGCSVVSREERQAILHRSNRSSHR